MSPETSKQGAAGRHPVFALATDGRDGGTGWRRYREPVGVVAASRHGEVLPLLAEVRRQTLAGRVAVGWIAYEAAPAFDAALVVRRAGAVPLAWFALFDGGEDVAAPEIAPGAAPFTPVWSGGPSRATYRGTVRRIHEHIAAGDTYQVNYTYRLRAPWEGDPRRRFAILARAQQSRYAVFLEAGRFAVLSASPELCFRLEDDLLTCRPMKGTAPRGLTLVGDRLQAAGLRASEKERAENVMIVDMVRNDLGRIARVGTVRVPRLWETERYPTLWQMTSTVRAETAAPLDEILTALFPSASITGAPKVRTMQIIREIERTPRGIYTGCVGVLGPGRRGWMNVAIRTLVVDRQRASAEYGTGSGIVWDARAGAEFDECRTKALVLGGLPPPFKLIETLAWTPAAGPLLLERHLRRIGDSAEYFGYACDAEAIRRRIVEATRGLRRPQRVRLLLDEQGGIEATVAPLGLRSVPLGDAPPRRSARLAAAEAGVTTTGRTAHTVQVGIAEKPVSRRDPSLYHKTTRRLVYERALAASPGCDDVILVNEEGEVTESTIANVVVRDEEGYWTPPVECGLLAGTFRSRLLERGAIREKRLSPADLQAAKEVWLINSVRGWRRCRFVHGKEVRRERSPAREKDVDAQR